MKREMTWLFRAVYSDFTFYFLRFEMEKHTKSSSQTSKAEREQKSSS